MHYVNSLRGEYLMPNSRIGRNNPVRNEFLKSNRPSPVQVVLLVGVAAALVGLVATQGPDLVNAPHQLLLWSLD